MDLRSYAQDIPATANKEGEKSIFPQFKKSFDLFQRVLIEKHHFSHIRGSKNQVTLYRSSKNYGRSVYTKVSYHRSFTIEDFVNSSPASLVDITHDGENAAEDIAKEIVGEITTTRRPRENLGNRTNLDDTPSYYHVVKLFEPAGTAHDSFQPNGTNM